MSLAASDPGGVGLPDLSRTRGPIKTEGPPAAVSVTTGRRAVEKQQYLTPAQPFQHRQRVGGA